MAFVAGCEPPDLVGRSRVLVLLVQVEVALVDVQPRDVDVTGEDPANPIRDKGNFFWACAKSSLVALAYVKL